LRYLTQHLERRGIDFCALTNGPDPSVAAHNEVDWLTAIAQKENCSLIHVMTFDGKGPAWLRYRSLRRSSDTPIIATCFLFSNLYEFPKCLFWDLLFARNLVNKVIVLDDYLKERSLPFWRRQRLAYAPDPYDPADFSPIGQSSARAKLGLPEDKAIFLMFGELSAGKGLMTLVNAARDIPDSSSTCVLLAGRLTSDVRQLGVEEMIFPLVKSGKIIIHNRYIEENDVALYFSAADYIVSPYPKWFKGSSGTFTRGCAAGRPSVVSDHGVLSEIVRRTDCGLTFAPENSQALSDTMQFATKLRNAPQYGVMASSGRRIAEERTVDKFADAVVMTYQETLM
jgi:glycosyltransferase involved in cell wall biosynthesis